VIRRLFHLDDGLPLADQLLGGFELAHDLLRYVPGPFNGRVSGPFWPDKDSHSPWTEFQGPRQLDTRTRLMNSRRIRFSYYKLINGMKQYMKGRFLSEMKEVLP